MKKITCDGASAVGEIAYSLSEVIPIYPITPSSPIAEYCSRENSKGRMNILGEIPKMIEMQSEGGVAGTLHGAGLSHALTSTFTSSQGLLLMLPDMFKIAGEGLPCVIHVSSRAVASHSLSIFCDHSDVMTARGTGFIILNSTSVQEACDFALASHMLALKSGLPVLHFFDGFRTSHEIQKIQMFEENDLIPLVKQDMLKFKSEFKECVFGSAQNPDVFFQNRERGNGKYQSVGKNLEGIFSQINILQERNYKPYEYYGKIDAQRVIVAMGSACKTIEEYIDNNPQEKIGLIKVRLYRPFFSDMFCSVIGKDVKTITVLDRTKENGSVPPLAQDVISALNQHSRDIKVLHGRYGLGGKEFTPAHVKAVYKNMLEEGKNNFTVGIIDDISHSNLEIENTPCNFNGKTIKIYGLGSDGSVSASKTAVKILGERDENCVQGYFEYDSKKSGSLTISHIRISPHEIKSEYLTTHADVIEINNFSFVHKYDCLKGLKQNGVVIINSIFSPQEIGRVLPKTYCQTLKDKNAKLYVINAQKIANSCSLGEKINIIMLSGLFKGAGLLDDKEREDRLSAYIHEMFSQKGEDVVNKNLSAMKLGGKIELVDLSTLIGKDEMPEEKIDDDFYNQIMKKITHLEGNEIPTSKFNDDGSSPLGTSKFEKRGIALRLPKWIKENCIQCGQCTLACPHSALRSILTQNQDESFPSAIGIKDKQFKISLSPLDCTGCGVCAKTCPAIKKALEMEEDFNLHEKKLKYEKDEKIISLPQNIFPPLTPKGLQFKQSLFRFSGACAGCGQTPYLKILTMLNGSNMMIANATGCSSIYSGTYASCPYERDENGGILWANSLFEDNAEFGLGLHLGSQFGRNKDKPVWIIGGDGWAYDIGYGGLDHILASGKNVNILVLDNQTYSNTGGQQSKATPTGAKVKFAENGKVERKKNLGEIALCYKDVFVGQICFGGNITHTIKTLKDAQDYNGTSIVIAYCTCVNQGIDMSNMTSIMREATQCGFWPIYSYNPNTKNLNLLSDFDEENYLTFLNKQRRFKNCDNALKQKQINTSKEFILKLKNMQKNG